MDDDKICNCIWEEKYLLLDQNYASHIKRVSLLETQGIFPTVAFELIFQVTGMLGVFLTDQEAELWCCSDTFGFPWPRKCSNLAQLDSRRWGFLRSALLRGDCSWELSRAFRLFHQLGFTWRTSSAGPTVLPHRNIAWNPLPLGGSNSPVHGGRDEACWTTAEQLDFLPASLHTQPSSVPCGATSAFGTGVFQVTVSSVRVKAHPKLQMKWQPLPWWSVSDYPTESLI